MYYTLYDMYTACRIAMIDLHVRKHKGPRDVELDPHAQGDDEHLESGIVHHPDEDKEECGIGQEHEAVRPSPPKPLPHEVTEGVPGALHDSEQEHVHEQVPVKVPDVDDELLQLATEHMIRISSS